MASRLAYCKGCRRNTKHYRRRDGVAGIKSLFTLGVLKPRYYRCSVCSYRVWFPKTVRKNAPTIK